MLLWVLTVFVTVSAGELKPKTSRPVRLEYTNVGVMSEYSFWFQIERATVAISELRIEFPRASFASGLGGVICTAILGNEEQRTCWVKEFTIYVAIGELSNSPVDNTYSVSVSPVLNPAIPGLTGYFQLSTWTGINLLDYNDFFAQVGVMPGFLPITLASASCIHSCLSGDFDEYQLSFTPPIAIPSTSRVSLKLTDNFSWDQARGCRSDQIPPLLCTQTAPLTIKLSNFGDSFKPGVQVKITFPNVLNPYQAGQRGAIEIEIMEEKANTLVTRIVGIAGPAILPNSIKVVGICPNGGVKCVNSDPYVTIDSRIDFTLTAQTTNDIPSGGSIQLSFSTSFGLLESNTCVVLSGLIALSGDLACVVNPTTKTAVVQNLARFARGMFAIRVRITTPHTSGLSGTFKIATYTDSGMTSVVDSTDSPVSIEVMSMNKISGWGVTWTPDPITRTTIMEAQGNVKINLTFMAGDAIPTPCTLRIRFPMGFVLPDLATLLTSKVNVNTATGDILVTTARVDLTYNTLELDIPNDILAPTLQTGVGASSTQALVSGLFTLPRIPEEYPIEVVLVQGGIDINSFLYWVRVVPQAFASPKSVSNLSRDVKALTVYEFTFTPTVDVPASAGNAVYGEIEISFPTDQSVDPKLLWAKDLGTNLTSVGEIPCKLLQGLTPINNSDLVCTLNPQTIVPSYVAVTISNFQAIPAGTPVQFIFAGIANIQLVGSSGVIVTTYSKIQTYANPLNQEIMVLARTAWDTSLAPPLVNGRSAPPDGDGENKVEFLPNTLRASTLMRFLFWPEKDIPNTTTKPGSAILLKFPMTYPLPASGVQCLIHYTQPIDCYTIPNAGWIVVSGLSTGFSAHSEYPFDVTGLKNPKHRIPRARLTITCIVDYKESEYLNFVDFPLLDLGVISPAVVTADNYEAAHIDTTYFFVFTPTSELGSSSKIVVTFPKNSYVTTTTPVLECLLSGLAPAYGAHTTCSYKSNAVEIIGFGSRPGNSSIIVKLKHVLNPVEVGLTDFFAIETFSEVGYLVDANYAIVGVLINSKHPIAKLRHISTWADPSNGLMPTSVTVAFIPTVTLPAGATIDVYFPQAEFPALPTTPQCEIAGGLISMYSCITSTTVLRIVTDAPYISIPQLDLPINITLSGLKNFTPGVTSGPVFIQIQYSGIVVNESPQDESNRKMLSDLEPTIMTAETPTYAPVTAAEEAMYNMTFRPINDFPANCTFSLTFEANFPRRLGRFLHCFARAISLAQDGTVDCSAKGRTVTMVPQRDYVRRDYPALEVAVARVINPDFGLGLGSIAGYSKCGTYILDYVSFSTTFYVTPLPQSLIFNATSVSTHETGTISTVSITAMAFVGFVYSPQDQILIDFPAQYELDFVESSIGCISPFEVSTRCRALANRVSISPFTPSSLPPLSNYTLNITGVENPWDPQEAPFLTLALYQAKTMTVIAKTIANLAVISSLSFETVGQEIRINGNRGWVQQKGTRSEFIYIYLQTGCPIPFTLSGKLLPNGISITPALISFGLGDISARFQINIESTVRPGRYTLSWTSYGYWKRQVYAPVRRTKLTVIANALVPISVASVDVVPQGGISFPNIVKLPYAPATQLLLQPIKLGSKPTKVIFIPSILNFTAGDTIKSFLIEVDPGSKGDVGEFFLHQSGADAKAFSLNQSIFRFNVGNFYADVCEIQEMRVVNVTRTTGQLKFSTNVEIALSWMLAMHGTRPPTLDELRTQKFTDSVLSPPLFGVTRDSTPRSDFLFDYALSLTGLQTGTRYSVFLAGTSETERTSMQTCEFTTVKQFRPAYATLRFRQSSLGDGDKAYLVSELAGALMLNATRLHIADFEKYPSTLISEEEEDAPLHTTTTSSGRSLQGVSLYHLLIVFEPFDAMPLTPFQYLSTLNNNLLSLRKVFPTFDDGVLVKAKQLGSGVPSFKLQPKLGVITNASVEIVDFLLDDQGMLYFCLSPETPQTSQPSSFQIFSGVDNLNEPCNQHTYFLGGPILSNVSFPGLKPDTVYWVYATAGNLVPGMPDLMEDGQVVGVGFMTQAIVKVEMNVAGVVTLVGVWTVW